MYKLFFVITLVCYINVLSAQVQDMKYSRAKVNLIGRNIHDLSKAGIETDHGNYVKNRYFESDFSSDELAILNALNFEYSILIDDVSAYYADSDRPSEIVNPNLWHKNKCDGLNIGEYNYRTPSQYTKGSMGGYFTYQEMLAILDTMAARYPHLISVRKDIDGFVTHNGNKLFYVKVSDDVSKEDEAEPKVLYNALHHAREPNGLSQMLFYLWYLLENYELDPIVKKIVNQTQMYFIPCVNPDGYLQNQKNNPKGGGLWRKNTWKDSLGVLKGVDLNRNYGYFWGFDNVGSSTNPNSQTYRGSAPFSEPETQAVRAFCLAHDFKIALNYHTFGNYLIHPWGFNDKPTAEDQLFKALGNVMNRENNFIMGTGTETVGYVTNGDSDDWMYGETGEKNAIYSYTPEVGPSFWPAQVDIDYLNKSCMWMNLSAALLTLSYYDADEKVSGNYLSTDNNKISIEVQRAGLKDGSAIISLKALTEGVSVLNPVRMVTITDFNKTILDFELDIDPTFDYTSGISLLLSIDNDGIISDKTITKNWLSVPPSTILFNNFNDIQSFETTTWNLTSTTFYSASTSLTDSPVGNYPPNYNAHITLKNPIDLSNVSYAFLNFYAKWDIEDNYDYAQVLASSDNRDFIPLCGKYTNPGTTDQSFNSPLYDGKVSEWVKEEMDLSFFAGKPQVWLRFVMHSDQYEERDGFYIDDLEIKGTLLSTDVNDLPQHQVRIVPNIITSATAYRIVGKEIKGKTILMFYNQLGQPVLTIHPESNEVDLNTTGMQSGMYFYSIMEGAIQVGFGKVVVIK